MKDEEEQIAFKQWCKDWGDNFKGMPKNALWQIYRSMDLENRKEFLEESKEKKINEYSRITKKIGRE